MRDESSFFLGGGSTRKMETLFSMNIVVRVSWTVSFFFNDFLAFKWKLPRDRQSIFTCFRR